VEHLARRRAREDHVPAGLPDHAVAVAPAHVRVTGGVRRADGDLDAGLPPQLGDARRVHLRPPRFGVVEITPRQHADAMDPRLGGEIAELGELLAGIGSARDRIVAGHDRANRTWSGVPEGCMERPSASAAARLVPMLPACDSPASAR
jgi:hypothetical protein